jgi:hypothetical protein
MSSIFRSVANYLGFYTSGAPAPVTTTADDGTLTTVMVAGPTEYVTPNVVMPRTFIGVITLGDDKSLPKEFTNFDLAGIDFNPPLTSFTISKVVRVTIRAPPCPLDINWYAGIWAPLESTGSYDRVARRAPNTAWVWRSNVTTQPIIEHVVPWPLGFPVMDSLHATLPGLHRPALQIGFENKPTGTATAATKGGFKFTIIVDAEVAGYGMLGTL